MGCTEREVRGAPAANQKNKQNLFAITVLVSIDDIYFLESENPKGWMAKVETGG
jgi:hypothetical protein